MEWQEILSNQRKNFFSFFSLFIQLLSIFFLMEKLKDQKESELKTLKVSPYTHTLVSELQKITKGARANKRKPTQDEVLFPLVEKAFKKLVRA